MEWTGPAEPEDQSTWVRLVIEILRDHLSRRQNMLDIRFSNTTFKHPLDRMDTINKTMRSHGLDVCYLGLQESRFDPYPL